ncbi:MAG: antitoxin family protein [Pirellulales bacterium]
MNLVHAIYENGVFRPTVQVDLPEHCAVEFEPRITDQPASRAQALAAVYEIMSKRFDSGETDVAERHNEHQP